MQKNMSLFSQMLQFFPRIDFARHVKEHQAERHARGFSCWQQLVSMLFCQLGKANTLSEITNGLATCEGKLRHIGIRAPKKSTLSYVNAHRPWQLYRSVFFDLLSRCKEIAGTKKRKFRFKNKLYSIDSTTIDLCATLFDWAHFRKTKGGIKLHLRLDHDGYLPDFGVISEAKLHDSKILKDFSFQPGSIYVLDRAYNDYGFFNRMCEKGSYFVTRMKKNARYRVLSRAPVTKGNDIVCDQMIKFTGFYQSKKCSHVLRRIKIYDRKNERYLVFLTNNNKLAASTIAFIYKERWKIELFFKALKQNLKIKTFVGTTANALKTQIWTALIAMLLLKYLKLKSTFAWSLSNLSALLRMNLFTYRDLWKWINQPYETVPIQIESQQLSLNFS